MNAADSHRHALPLRPLDVLGRIPDMGAVQVGIRVGGALLEGIGPVLRVHEDRGEIVLHGPGSETRIAVSAIARIVCDQMVMARIMPFLELLDADGSALVKITALDGLEAFDAALDGIQRTALDAASPPARPAAGDVEPASGPLREAQAAGTPVTLAASKPGISHRWTGRFGNVSFERGFLNVIEPDMHLHVRAGGIADWREEPAGQFSALDKDGVAIGLTLAR
jgi:hypothetical protein